MTTQAELAQPFTMVDACDYVSVPVGGQVTFCRQVAEEFGPQVDLVGISTGPERQPQGRWGVRTISGARHRYFSLYDYRAVRRPRIPLRLRNLFYTLLSGRRMLAHARGLALVNSPEIAIGLYLASLGRARFAYIFHGTENPLEMPRYKWGKLVARPFEWLLFKSLSSSPAVLACSDDNSIARLEVKMGRLAPPGGVRAFRMVYDDSFYAPSPAPAAPRQTYRMVCVGRINHRKGWRLLLEALAVMLKQSLKRIPELVFVGDGEERALLEEEAVRLGVADHVRVTGMVGREVVRQHLWDADLVVFGSYYEGWSIAMLEALACAKPIVSTQVSGTETLIEAGSSGFVCPTRDPAEFAALLVDAERELPSVCAQSVKKADPYRRSLLRARMVELFDGIAK